MKRIEIERERRGILQEVPPRLDEPMLVPIPEENGVPKLAPRGACGPGTKKESRGTYSHALSYQIHIINEHTQKKIYDRLVREVHALKASFGHSPY